MSELGVASVGRQPLSIDALTALAALVPADRAAEVVLAYCNAIEAQEKRLMVELTAASSSVGSVSDAQSWVQEPKSEISVNSSVSSSKSRKRARWRANVAARRAASVAAVSVVSTESQLSYTTPMEFGLDCGSGRCYASLFTDVGSAVDLLGNAPTFREVLKLWQWMLPIEVIRRYSVERTGPGMYHLGSRGPSVVQTFSMLVEHEEQFADSVFRGLSFPAILRGKVKLDDRLGMDVRGFFRRMYLGAIGYTMGPVVPPCDVLILPGMSQSSSSDCIVDSRGRDLQGTIHTVADWRRDIQNSLIYRSCTTAFAGVSSAWLTFSVHNDQPHLSMAVAFILPKDAVIRQRQDAVVQILGANRCLWIIVESRDVVFDLHWSVDFGLAGMNFHVIRDFGNFQEISGLPIGALFPVDTG